MGGEAVTFRFSQLYILLNQDLTLGDPSALYKTHDSPAFRDGRQRASADGRDMQRLPSSPSSTSSVLTGRALVVTLTLPAFTESLHLPVVGSVLSSHPHSG